MARILLGAGNSSVQYFGIRPDQDHLVFRGSREESSSILLKGVIVLCTTEPLKAQEITLRFTGEARTSFGYLTAGSTTRYIKQESEFLRHRWQFEINYDPKHPNLIPAGNHEWPFELVLPGNLPESVEGNLNSWVVYRLKAVVDRGLFAKNIESRQHIRLIRTFDPSSLELAHTMSIRNIWPEKISYQISTPQKGVVFGSQVHVDFELVPLLKGLRIGKITSVAMQTLEVTVDAKGEPLRTKQYVDEVATDQFELPEDAETQNVDGAEGYVFSRQIQLPRSLQACLQSVDEKNILAKHQLKFTIALHNPDGHLSELRAHLPIHLFISPNMRLNDHHELDASIGPSSAVLDAMTLAPPGYGEHQLDALYMEVDPQTFVTPGPSRMASRSQSRRGSDEGVEGLDAPLSGEVSANTLLNRLVTLANRDPASHTGANGTAALRNGTSSHTGSSYVSRQGSADLGGSRPQPARQLSFAEPQHIEYNSEALSRVPSYNTALHSSTRTHATRDLPDYQAATSRPPSGSDAERFAQPAPSGSGHGERHARFAGVVAEE